MKHFQLGVWNNPSNDMWIRLEEETVKRYAGSTKVFKQKFDVKIPTLSMILLNSCTPEEPDGSLIAELVLWNFTLKFNKFLDYRKDLTLRAHSLQILRELPKVSTPDPTC